ncbi:MAG: class I SAM-dependent methyltransferase [Candidatus Sulfobium sp.]
MLVNKSVSPCIFCREDTLGEYFVKKTEQGEYPIVRCNSCGSAYVWPRPDVSAMAAYYRHASYSNLTLEQAFQSDLRYYPDSGQDSRRIIERCIKLASGKRFLDAGAGFGMFTRTALRAGFEVSACEPNSNARKAFGELNGFEPESCLFDREYAECHLGAFEVVLLSQVLEHVTEPEEVVKYINTVLCAGGVAAIAVPYFGSALSRVQGKGDMFISPPEHLNFFSKRGLIALFDRRQFRLEHIETVSKVNKGRIRDAVRFPLLRDGVWIGLYGVLKVFEAFGMGMVVNAYFRKLG